MSDYLLLMMSGVIDMDCTHIQSKQIGNHVVWSLFVYLGAVNTLLLSLSPSMEMRTNYFTCGVSRFRQVDGGVE